MPKYEVPTTGTVEKIYLVEAKDAEQAHARVRSYIDDPEMLGEGIVVRQEDRTRYKSGEQVRGTEIKEAATGPQAVEAKAS